MDNTASSSTTQDQNDTQSELAHVTQAMYKQNLELAERNKTLSLLRKIDEIVLNSVTDTKQIAEQVATAVVTEADFKLMTIFLVDKKNNILTPLAISQLDFGNNDDLNIHEQFDTITISLLDKDNPVVTVVNQRQMHVFHKIEDFLSQFGSSTEIVTKIKAITGVEALLVYPLIVRTEVIGVMMIGIGENETSLSQYQRDLIGRLVGVVGIAIDNALLYQKIQDANERLKEIDRLKDEFVSLASHELRTPMTIIKNYLWMLMHDPNLQLSQKQTEYLSRAYSSTDRLILLVNDMLNVSRIESGRFTVNFEKTDLIALIQDTIAELEPRGQELGIKLLTQQPPTLKAVKADPQRIKQVLINLIGNSLKFTPEGGTITTIIEAKENEILIQVTDTGAGMTAEDISKLFQKFGTVGNEFLQKKNTQGTGLGLYITKSIIKLHGGRIWAESAGENKGATFSFTLPYFDDQKDTEQPKTAPIPTLSH